jgi:hypothetical protein
VTKEDENLYARLQEERVNPSTQQVPSESESTAQAVYGSKPKKRVTSPRRGWGVNLLL